MVSDDYESFLPRVEESDLLSLVFEDVTDPQHRERWRSFAKTNPRLATEVLKLGYVASYTEQASSQEFQKTVVDIVSFVISALETAAKRLKDKEEPLIYLIGDDDDEDPPLSA
jgi:hypothetical protein